MNPLIDDVRRVLLRDLDTLADQLQRYPAEDRIWAPLGDVPNSAGTLALHLTGNLQHYIGAVLGRSGYVRDRPGEFADRDVSRAQLLARIEATREAVDETLGKLDPARLDEPFPVPIGGVTLPTGRQLLHFATHFAYHLGQVDYHRRAVTGDGTGVGAQSVPALAD
jgi:uncharacterized damage-inducible protein DinB